MVIEARSRIDTWRKQQFEDRSHLHKVLHQPIQIEGKSRIDTWLRLPFRRAHSEEKVSDKNSNAKMNFQ